MRTSLVVALLGPLALGCVGGKPGDTGLTSGSYTSTHGSDHSGTLSEDQVWAADLNPHVVSGDVYLEGGTLTIGPGTVIQVADGRGIYVSYYGGQAGLRSLGTQAEPVTFTSVASTERGAWAGISAYDAADDANLSFSNTTLEWCGGNYLSGCLQMSAAEPLVEGLAIVGSEEGGFYFVEGARFATGSTNVSASDTAWAGGLDFAQGDSLPEEGASFAGNDDDRIWLAGDTVTTSLQIGDPGVAYGVSGDVYVEGTSATAAVVTLDAGVHLEFSDGRGLYLGYYGGASGLVATGTSADPVVFASAESTERGAWAGIGAYDSVDDTSFRFVNTRIESAGGNFLDGGLSVSAAEPYAENLEITGSEDAGFSFVYDARWAEGSSGLLVSGNAYTGVIDAASADSVPESGAILSGNDVDLLWVSGGTISESGTWGDVGVPYAPYGDIYLEGIATDPAVLTLEPGVTLAFDDGRGLYLSYYGGASGLMAEGTAASPVSFTAASSLSAGAWAGVGFFDGVDDAQSVISNADIGYGGGNFLSGNLSFSDASPTVSDTSVHDSEEWGIYLDGDAAPSITDVSYARNDAGDINR